MENVTLSIAAQVTGVDEASPKGARAISIGDTVAVHNTDDIATLQGGVYRINGGIGSTRIVFLHVKNCPDGTLANLSEIALVPVLDGDFPVRDRAWAINVQALTPEQVSTVTSDREFTAEFAAFAQVFIEKKINDVDDKTEDSVESTYAGKFGLL